MERLNVTTFNHLPFELIEKILLYAQEYSPTLCMVSQLWKDITSSHRFNNVVELSQLALEGHIELLRWIHHNTQRVWNWKIVNSILVNAAAGGHEQLCRLAKEWGADSVDCMLIVATEHNHENLCRLAKEWGANDFNLLLLRAAYGDGYEGFCRLAKEWGATSAR